MWILDYLDDLDADFRTFYRFPADGSAPGIAEGEFGNLSSPRFFRLAERTPALNGVMTARLTAEKMKENERQQGRPASTPAQSTQPASQERRQVTVQQLMLLDPTLIQYEKV